MMDHVIKCAWPVWRPAQVSSLGDPNAWSRLRGRYWLPVRQVGEARPHISSPFLYIFMTEIAETVFCSLLYRSVMKYICWTARK